MVQNDASEKGIIQAELLLRYRRRNSEELAALYENFFSGHMCIQCPGKSRCSCRQYITTFLLVSKVLPSLTDILIQP